MKSAYRKSKMLLTVSFLATIGCISTASAQAERRALEIPPDLQAPAKAAGKDGKKDSKGEQRRKVQRTRATGASAAASPSPVSNPPGPATQVPAAEVKIPTPEAAEVSTVRPETVATKAAPVGPVQRKKPRPLDLSSAALRKPVAASLIPVPPRSPVAKLVDKTVDRTVASEGGADKDPVSSVAVRTPQAPPVAAPVVTVPSRSLKVALAEPGTAEIAGMRSMTDAGPAAGGVHALIAHHAAANGVPVALATAVVRVESRFNPRARNGVNVGLTQISTATARGMGYQGPVQGLYDADTNLRYGIRYLAQAYRLAGGDTCRTVLKYQAGHRATSMTGAARAYCAKVKPHVSRR